MSFKNIVAVSSLLIISFFSVAQAQQKVLFVTTVETRYSDVVDNAYDTLSMAYGPNEIDDKRGTLGDNATGSLPDLSGYEMVFVVGIEDTLTTNETAIIDAIKNRASQSFVLFIDSCCQAKESALNILNAVVPASASSPFTFGTFLSTPFAEYSLSTTSVYRDSFVDSAPLQGGYYNGFQNMNPTNVLYTAPDGSSVGTFFSQVDTQGACVFSFPDLSVFVSSRPGYYYDNPSYGNTKLGAAFKKAVASGGSCFKASNISGNTTPVPLTTWGSLLIIVLGLMTVVVIRTKRKY